MSVPVPLGVRIYSVWWALDVWVTDIVEDLEFRSVVPGGFSSATLRLRDDGNQSRALLAALFNRVQVVDLRTMEIAWEGRVEDPSHTAADDGEVWELGVTGTMACTSDWKVPLWYADAGLDGWIAGDPGNPPSVSLDTIANTSMSVTLKQGFTWSPGNSATFLWNYTRPLEAGMYLGRFTLTYDGTGTGSEADFDVIAETEFTARVDVTAFDAGSGAPQTKTNIVGDVNSFTSTADYGIILSVQRQAAPATTFNTTRDSPAVRITPVGVQALRLDRTGNRLVAVSDYSHGDFVLVRHIVEDVIGRLLVGNSDVDDITPWRDFATVNPGTVFIDTSDTTQIKTLMYLDGATAADVLNDMMTVQTGAYWAVWESSFGAVHGANGLADTGYRIEWATWPAGWGYLVSSQDGLEEQPTARDVYDNVVVKYTANFLIGQPPDALLVPAKFPSAPTGDARPPDLAAGGISRATIIDKAQPTDDNGARDTGTIWLAQRDQRFAKNAGTLTVKRPIAFYDAGANSDRGAARMVDPWMIRPGKLLRIIDQIPDGDMTNFAHGTAAPPDSHAGTVYRVVATDYSLADNTCRLELDQPTRWSLTTQVATGSTPASPKVQ